MMTYGDRKNQRTNFEEIIIRQDKNLRGRTADEIVELLIEGINEAKTSDIPVKVIQKEKDAILYAYKNATPGSLVTIMCDVVPDALEFVKNLKEEEDREVISKHA